MKRLKTLNSLMKFQIYGSDGETEIDEFKKFEIDITKLKETLFPRVDQEQEKVENEFCKAILYA